MEGGLLNSEMTNYGSTREQGTREQGKAANKVPTISITANPMKLTGKNAAFEMFGRHIFKTCRLTFSSQETAHNFDLLKKTGITHILNVATGVRNRFSDDFSYLAITVDDSPTENIKSFFAEALDFMYKAVENGGKILVHCNAGISRSSTLVMAYIMQHERKTFKDAFLQVKSVRYFAQPNDGFISQLREFEKELSL